MIGSDIFERDVLFFGGKGGTGKTTCAVSVGLRAAEEGEGTLVFSTDPAHSLSDLFEQEIGDEVTAIEGRENLHAYEIDSKKAMEKERKWWLPKLEEMFEDLPKRSLEKEILEKMWESPLPDLGELMALLNLIDFLEEEEFDTIVVDTAAGAHTLSMMELPEVAEEWFVKILEVLRNVKERETPKTLGRKTVVRHLSAYRKIRDRLEDYLENVSRLRSYFTDPETSGFVLVTIPEKMGFLVTKDMQEALEGTGVSYAALIINFLLPESPLCGFCESRREQQIEYVEKYRESFKDCEIVEMPVLPQNLTSMDLAEEASKVIFDGHSPETPETEREVTKHAEIETGGLDLGGSDFILFGGKGGCGKTTCSAAAGVHLAGRDSKVLVVSTDPQRSLSDSLNLELKDDKITEVGPVSGLHALEIDTGKTLKNFREDYREGLKELASASKFLTEEEAEDIIELPIRGGMGFDEIAALLRIVRIVEKADYDTIILDTAPTGHTMSLLELPDLIEGWMKRLLGVWGKVKSAIHHFKRGQEHEAETFLSEVLEDSERLRSKLTSPTTTFVPVTTPDDMALRETERLMNLIESHRIRADHIVINKLTPSNECPYCALEHNSQNEVLSKVREKLPNQKIVGVPLFPHEINGVKNLEKYASVLF